MKKFFLWLTFFHKYYLNELREYTKPIKTNIIKHNDISALIDPYIQAYVSHYKSVRNKISSAEYHKIHRDYILPKLTNVIIFDKNKYIFPVYLDIQAYFTSKIRQINDNINTMTRIKKTLIHLDIKAPEFKSKAIMDLIKIYSASSRPDTTGMTETITNDVNNIDSVEKLEEIADRYYNNSFEILNKQIKTWTNIINKGSIYNELEDALETLSVI